MRLSPEVEAAIAEADRELSQLRQVDIPHLAKTGRLRPVRATKPKAVPNVTAMLELGAGALSLTQVTAAYGKALAAAGKGEAVSFAPATIDACAAVLALLRRYRAKR